MTIDDVHTIADEVIRETQSPLLVRSTREDVTEHGGPVRLLVRLALWPRPADGHRLETEWCDAHARLHDHVTRDARVSLLRDEADEMLLEVLRG